MSDTCTTTTLTTSFGNGSLTLINLGATITSFKVNNVNVILGYPNVSDYLHPNNPYAGATIGQVANRIADAKLKLPLAGKESYELVSNDAYAKKGASCLHGGSEGFHQKIFQGPKVEKDDTKSTATYTLHSPHLGAGFPGAIYVTAIYTLSEAPTPDGKTKVSLSITYEATLSPSSPVPETVVALTNHSYFTVFSAPTILGINNDTLIPDGTITTHPSSSTSSPNDSFKFTVDGSLPAFDNCLVLPSSSSASSSEWNLDTLFLPLKPFTHIYHPDTKLHLEASTTEPAFQFTTGESMTRAPGFGSRAGFALEAQRYVNAVNEPGWLGQVKLGTGEVWGSRTVYEVWED